MLMLDICTENVERSEFDQLAETVEFLHVANIKSLYSKLNECNTAIRYVPSTGEDEKEEALGNAEENYVCPEDGGNGDAQYFGDGDEFGSVSDVDVHATTYDNNDQVCS